MAGGRDRHPCLAAGVVRRATAGSTSSPLPARPCRARSAPVVSNVPRPRRSSASTTATGAAHNLHPSPGAGGHETEAHEPVRHNRSGAPSEPWLAPVSAGAARLGRRRGVLARLALRRSPPEPRSGVLAAWREATRTLDLAGIRRRRAETYRRARRACRGRPGCCPKRRRSRCSDLARLATAACYAPRRPGEAGLDQALRDARTVVRSARRRVARWQLVAAALDPRGLPA